MSDVIIGNITARNIGSESQVTALLSGMRVICKKAFGDVPVLQYDKETTFQLIAQAKKKRPNKPRYTKPVDFGGSGGVWMSIVKERRAVKHLPDTSTAKAKILRNHAIFLERHDAVSRSDCETKCDVRREEYFRVYDEEGDLQDQPLLSTQLNGCLVGNGGHIRRNYLDPKDPRKKGDWSDTVRTMPLRLSMLVDTNKPWLEDEETVGYLCSIRVKRDYFRCMEALGQMDKIPKGKTWTAISTTSVNGKLLDLKPQTIASLVKKRAAAGGLNVKTTESAKTEDEGETLAGHFLRGHAGSIAYSLAVYEGASWDPLLGIDRARHTLASFQKSYSRGIAPRLEAQFRQHSRKAELRFEEAARL
jgi:hypothetical protein